MREKVGKSRNAVFFQWFVAPEGRKVGSLKRRVRSQLATGAIKNCAPLWREAHFEVKSVKKLAVSDHFWKLRCRKSARRCGAKYISKSKCTKHTIVGSLLEVAMSKKVHAVVVRSTFPSQNVQNTPGPDHFWKLRCRKSARRCGAKHISKSKCTKHTMLGPLLEVQMLKKVYAVVARSTLRSHTTLQYITPPVHSTTLNYTTPHYITLNDTATQTDR